MSTQLPVKWHGGHMLVEPFPGAGVWALLDTGAGHTASHRKGDGYLGSTLSDIEALAGTRIDLLVGLDAFRSQPVLLTREFVEFGAARPDGVLVPARRGSTVMQLSVSREGMADTECWGFFDSGAEFSYIDPSLIEPSSCCGIVEDFFPPIGKYQAMQFVSRARLGSSSVTLRPIVPIATKVGVTSAQRQLLIGSELIRQGDLWIDLSSDHFIWRARNGVVLRRDSREQRTETAVLV